MKKGIFWSVLILKDKTILGPEKVIASNLDEAKTIVTHDNRQKGNKIHLFASQGTAERFARATLIKMRENQSDVRKGAIRV